MPDKTITIREEVYQLLINIKRAHEDFSDLLERLVTGHGQKMLSILEQLQGTIEFEDPTSLIEDIRKRREQWRA
ncbi:MAG: antitoxin VapB family protein [Candidatus Heimdallarchaeota archaeon]